MRSIYAQITDTIISELENAKPGVALPWHNRLAVMVLGLPRPRYQQCRNHAWQCTVQSAALGYDQSKACE